MIQISVDVGCDGRSKLCALSIFEGLLPVAVLKNSFPEGTKAHKCDELSWN
jgi:hypothetical protein